MLRRQLAFLVGSAAVAWLGSCEPLPDTTPVAAAKQPREASLFSRNWVWTDEQGKAVTFSQWGGSPIVVGAIYTTCTRTCPQTVEKLRKVDEAFRKAGRSAQFVLVTLDPSVDTPERLRQFKELRKLPVGWHLLAGGKYETLEMMDLLGIHILDMESHVFHDTRVAVFDAQGMTSRNFACCDFDDAAALP